MMKIFLGGIAFVLMGILAPTIYIMVQMMTMKDLISCSANRGNIRIQTSLCKYYMLNYRLTEADIKELNDNGGLKYILHGYNPDRYEMAKIFITHGLDINGLTRNDVSYSASDYTLLHHAAWTGNVEEVKFLLSQGADYHIKNKEHGSALDIAKKIHRENDEIWDRSEIIRILTEAENTGTR